MNTTTQTAPVSPVVQESEMASIRSIFDRAANAIVQASELAVQVNQLSQTVKQLQDQMDTVRRQNQWLDESLASVRGQRDAVQAENHKLHGELDNAKAQIEGLTSAKASAEHVIQGLQAELEQTRKERDDYGMRHMEASDTLEQTKTQLAKIREVLGLNNLSQGSINPAPTPDEPAPVLYAQAEDVNAYPAPTGNGDYDQNKPGTVSPAPEPYKHW